jgi:BA14K-like protein
MEITTMLSTKMLSTAAALALLVPVLTPTASFAEGKFGHGGAAYHAPGGGMRMGGGAPAARFAAGAPAARPGGGAAWTGGHTNWNGGGTTWNGGRTGWNGGGAWRGDRHDYGRRFIPGAVAGAVIGGALASGPYAYYDGPGYYNAPAYYDDQYVDDGAVGVVQVPVGEDSAAYCAQRYRSYDPASQTYLGNDGYRHPCP